MYSGGDAGPAGRVRCVGKYNAESPKQRSKRFTFIKKTIHFSHLGLLGTGTLYIWCTLYGTILLYISFIH